MGKLTKQNSNLPTLPTKNPDKTETWAGKHTARVTKIFNQPDGSTVKASVPRRVKTEGNKIATGSPAAHIRGHDGIGRHARFRFSCSNALGFESPCPHH